MKLSWRNAATRHAAERGLAALAAIGFTLAATQAWAADRIRLAVQRTGTLAWELQVIKAHGLDKRADLDIETTELASTEAGKIAIKGGSADMMLSDWLWVSRERSLGDTLVFYPSSSTLGAVMVAPNSPIRAVTDLKGRTFGVVGGPLDKSWLLLRALARRSGLDLKMQAKVVYGAPPLLSQKQLQGETDATLTYWNFCADLESKGLKRAIEMDDVMRALGAQGRVAMLGYTFDGKWASHNKSAVDRFLDAIGQAKQILAESPIEWQHLKGRIGIKDDAALAIYQQRYRDGIFHRSISEEEADARALYRVLAEIGGPDLVGPSRELAPGTFYRPGG